jgi:hypothetical protein
MTRPTIRFAAAAGLTATLAITGVGPTFGHDGAEHATHAAPGNPSAVEITTERVEHVANFPFTGGHVMTQGDRLYVGSYGEGMRIFDISDPGAPELIGSYLPGARADAPPDAAVFDGRHIAVLNGTRRTSSNLPGEARTDRTEFLDVTDPSDPKLLWTFGPDQVDGESHNGDIVDRRRIYLPSGGVGAQGLRIYDLRPLLGETPAAPANLFRGDPVALWESSPYRRGRAVGKPFTHTHDITVYVDHPVQRPNGTWTKRDIALLAEGGAYANDAGNTGSMMVIDITDPRAPVALLRKTHARGDGHHPIRYHHEAQFIHGLSRVVLVTDEDLHNGCGDAGGAVAYRLSPDLTTATELSEWFIPATTPAPVCSVHVFNSRNGLVFFGAYNAGLQIVDYRDPRRPRQIDQAIEPGTTAWGAHVHRGYVYVGDVSRGLDVFRYTPPGSATSAATAREAVTDSLFGWRAGARFL